MGTVSEVLLVAGAAWSVLAAIGVNRFGDVYARMHAATKTTTIGVLFVLIGTAIELRGLAGAKVMLAGGMLFLTAPIGAHLIGRAVHHNTGLAPMRIDRLDELRDLEREMTDGDGGRARSGDDARRPASDDTDERPRDDPDRG